MRICIRMSGCREVSCRPPIAPRRAAIALSPKAPPAMPGGQGDDADAPIEPPQYFDPAEPWDAQSAEALTHLYEFGRRLPAPAARGRACAAPAAGAGRIACRCRPMTRQASDNAWLEARLAEIAERLQSSLAEHQSGQGCGPPQPPARCDRGAFQRGAEPGGPALGPGWPQAHRSPRDGVGRARRAYPGPASTASMPSTSRCRASRAGSRRAIISGSMRWKSCCRTMSRNGARAMSAPPAPCAAWKTSSTASANPSRPWRPRSRLRTCRSRCSARSASRRAHDRKRSPVAGLRRCGPRAGTRRPALVAGCGRLHARKGACCGGAAGPFKHRRRAWPPRRQTRARRTQPATPCLHRRSGPSPCAPKCARPSCWARKASPARSRRSPCRSAPEADAATARRARRSRSNLLLAGGITLFAAIGYLLVDVFMTTSVTPLRPAETEHSTRTPEAKAAAAATAVPRAGEQPDVHSASPAVGTKKTPTIDSRETDPAPSAPRVARIEAIGSAMAAAFRTQEETERPPVESTASIQ